jgi:WS/DGAT/MGAT family acyltransferase
VARKTLHAAEFVWNEGAATVAKPERMLEAAQFTADSAQALNKLLFTGTDEKTLFKGKCGVPKRAAWTKPLPLEEIKAIGQQIGATINDVILTAMTGALRRYLEKRTQEVDGFNIRAVVPVSIRPPQDFNKLGNRFGLVFLSLPIGVQDPLKRVLVLKRRMDMIKGTPEALVAFGILTAIGLTPQQIEHIIINIFAMKATAVMTNVPGPRQQLFFAGSAIRNLIFWVPTPGQLGLGVSILSYNGGVTLGVMTDEGLVPDPEKIIEGFYAEIELMRSWIVDTPEL